MMFAVRVKCRDAEKVRKHLIKEGLFDNKRRIVRKNNFVEIPVVAKSPEYEVIEQKNPVFAKKCLSFKDLKKMLKLDIKGGWEVIGDILIVELPEEVDKNLVGKVLIENFPRIKSVVNRKGIKGLHRVPEVEVIAGNGTETIHKENKCLFKIDVSKVMFCAGNIEERKRMAYMCRNETVLDMFAGIGQFSIPIAKHSKAKVYSIEKNPVAFSFLKENIKLNNLYNIVPIFGDCRKKSPKKKANRVIMGYFDSYAFLPIAIEALTNGGTIHFHALSPKSKIEEKCSKIKNIVEDFGFDSQISVRTVKSYAPLIWHVVFDIRL